MVQFVFFSVSSIFTSTEVCRLCFYLFSYSRNICLAERKKETQQRQKAQHRKAGIISFREMQLYQNCLTINKFNEALQLVSCSNFVIGSIVVSWGAISSYVGGCLGRKVFVSKLLNFRFCREKSKKYSKL